MKKTLQKKFILFAMSTVTILLVVLIGAINIFSWIVLDRQSDNILHTIAEGDAKFQQSDFRSRGPFLPPMSMDTIKSARFFMVCIDANGNPIDVNIDRISSVSSEQAVQYATEATEDSGKMGIFKYCTKRLGSDRLIFFMDTTEQIQTFMMVSGISCAIALICWIIILLFVILSSGRVIRPILVSIEKQKQFITNAGHELKTPLTIIQSNNDASTLIYGETKYSANIASQTKRLNMLMTNLLILAKLDEEAKFPTEPIDVSQILSELLPVYEESITQKKITLSSDIQPNLILRAHIDTFSQLLSILLDNAVKYTPDNGRIDLRLYRDGERIKLVEENTCHISCQEDPERLFDRCYRGDSARTQDHCTSGYGIGLSAARSIAELFGGVLKASYTDHETIRFTAQF